jgi:hypothetical protein
MILDAQMPISDVYAQPKKKKAKKKPKKPKKKAVQAKSP